MSSEASSKCPRQLFCQQNSFMDSRKKYSKMPNILTPTKEKLSMADTYSEITENEEKLILSVIKDPSSKLVDYLTKVECEVGDPDNPLTLSERYLDIQNSAKCNVKAQQMLMYIKRLAQLNRYFLTEDGDCQKTCKNPIEGNESSPINDSSRMNSPRISQHSPAVSPRQNESVLQSSNCNQSSRQASRIGFNDFEKDKNSEIEFENKCRDRLVLQDQNALTELSKTLHKYVQMRRNCEEKMCQDQNTCDISGEMGKGSCSKAYACQREQSTINCNDSMDIQTSRTSFSTNSNSLKCEERRSSVDDIVRRLYELEIQKKRLKNECGDVSAIRKKQRALLLHFQKNRDRHTSRTRKGNSMAVGSDELKACEQQQRRSVQQGQVSVNKEKNKRINKNPDADCECGSNKVLKQLDPTLLTSSFAHNQITLKMFEVETGVKMEELLKRREEDMAQRRCRAEKLMEWHKEILEEESYITKLESILINGSLKYLSPDQLLCLKNAKNILHTMTVPSTKLSCSISSPISPTCCPDTSQCPSSIACPNSRVDVTIFDPCKVLTEEPISLCECKPNQIVDNSCKCEDLDSSVYNYTDTCRISGKTLNKLWCKLSGETTDRFNANDLFDFHYTDFITLFGEAQELSRFNRTSTEIDLQKNFFLAKIIKYFQRPSSNEEVVQIGEESVIAGMVEEPKCVANQMANDFSLDDGEPKKKFVKVQKAKKSTFKIQSHKIPDYKKMAKSKVTCRLSPSKIPTDQTSAVRKSNVSINAPTSPRVSGIRSKIDCGNRITPAQQKKLDAAAAKRRMEEDKVNEERLQKLVRYEVPTDAQLKNIFYQEYVNIHDTSPNIYVNILKKLIRSRMARRKIWTFQFDIPDALTPTLDPKKYEDVMTEVFEIAKKMREVQLLTTDQVIDYDINVLRKLDRDYFKVSQHIRKRRNRFWTKAKEADVPPICFVQDIVQDIFDFQFNGGEDPLFNRVFTNIYEQFIIQQCHAYIKQKGEKMKDPEAFIMKMHQYFKRLHAELEIVKDAVMNDAIVTIPTEIAKYRAEHPLPKRYKPKNLEKMLDEDWQEFQIEEMHNDQIMEHEFMVEQTPPREIGDPQGLEISNEDEYMDWLILEIAYQARMNEYQLAKQIMYINKLINDRTNRTYVKAQRLLIRFRLLSDMQRIFRKELFSKAKEMEDNVVLANDRIDAVNKESVFNYVAFEGRLDIIGDAFEDIIKIYDHSPIICKFNAIESAQANETEEIEATVDHYKNELNLTFGQRTEKLEYILSIVDSINERFGNIQTEHDEFKNQYTTELEVFKEEVNMWLRTIRNEPMSEEEMADYLLGHFTPAQIQVRQAERALERIKEQLRSVALTIRQTGDIDHEVALINNELLDLRFILAPDTDESCVRRAQIVPTYNANEELNRNQYILMKQRIESEVPTLERVTAMVQMFATREMVPDYVQYLDLNNIYEVEMFKVIVQEAESNYSYVIDILQDEEAMDDQVEQFVKKRTLKVAKKHLKELYDFKKYLLDLLEAGTPITNPNYHRMVAELLLIQQLRNAVNSDINPENKEASLQAMVQAIDNQMDQSCDISIDLSREQVHSIAIEAVDRAVAQVAEAQRDLSNQEIHNVAANAVEEAIVEAEIAAEQIQVAEEVEAQREESCNLFDVSQPDFSSATEHRLFEERMDGVDVSKSECKIISYYTDHILNQIVSQVVEEIQDLYLWRRQTQKDETGS